MLHRQARPDQPNTTTRPQTRSNRPPNRRPHPSWIAALPVLRPGGLLAFHDYPESGWPDVRRVVDEHARRLGWERIAQAGYLGVFRTWPAGGWT